uniref:ATP-dependent DNA helicase n=1 Tax=Panagrolaimus davidi TaxID=227884 RepID=A0A914QDL2_9BILA
MKNPDLLNKQKSSKYIYVGVLRHDGLRIENERGDFLSKHSRRKPKQMTFLRKTFNKFTVRKKNNNSVIIDNNFISKRFPLRRIPKEKRHIHFVNTGYGDETRKAKPTAASQNIEDNIMLIKEKKVPLKNVYYYTKDTDDDELDEEAFKALKIERQKIHAIQKLEKKIKELKDEIAETNKPNDHQQYEILYDRGNIIKVEFVKWLDQVGSALNNVSQKVGNEEILTSYLPIPPEMQLQTLGAMVDFCFPANVLADPIKHFKEICSSSLLAPTNRAVDALNERILAALLGEAETIYSIDKVSHNETTAAMTAIDVNGADAMLEHIHEQTPTGLPPHKLTLKKGCKVMLIRNLSLRDGLCNGTILQVKKWNENLIWCVKPGVDGQPDREIMLPKVKFEYEGTNGKRVTPFSRIQFPIRVAFASTINKAQGQTLGKVGICLNEQQVFSHGQMYVALSRVRKPQDVRILSTTSGIPNTAINIVHKEFINI